MRRYGKAARSLCEAAKYDGRVLAFGMQIKEQGRNFMERGWPLPDVPLI